MGGGIGFYVHHHGRGHANRTRQIVEELYAPVSIFGSSVEFLSDMASTKVKIFPLPSDVVALEPDEENEWPSVFHYAPLKVRGLQQRMARIAGWIAETDPDLLVVDVSVEVALFARLCSLPVIYVRQHGERNDTAHLAAFQSSLSLLAPYSQVLEDPSVPEWMVRKTFYAGGFSRFDHFSMTKTQAREQLSMNADRKYVVVIQGMGGTGIALKEIVNAARHTPEWTWWVIGPGLGDVPAVDNIRVVGKIDNPSAYLKAADVVVGSAGNNTVMELASMRAKFVCIPEERPFMEQFSKAEALKRIGAASVFYAWPQSDRWPEILREAENSGTSAWQQVVNPEGARLAARHILQMAEKCRNLRGAQRS